MTIRKVGFAGLSAILMLGWTMADEPSPIQILPNRSSYKIDVATVNDNSFSLVIQEDGNGEPIPLTLTPLSKGRMEVKFAKGNEPGFLVEGQEMAMHYGRSTLFYRGVVQMKSHKTGTVVVCDHLGLSFEEVKVKRNRKNLDPIEVPQP